MEGNPGLAGDVGSLGVLISPAFVEGFVGGAGILESGLLDLGSTGFKLVGSDVFSIDSGSTAEGFSGCVGSTGEADCLGESVFTDDVVD